MATLDDYVGATFGAFTIGRHVGSGKDADVFTVTHRFSGLLFMLRLDASDPDIWAGDPLLPPANVSVERANAVGTFAARRAFAAEQSGASVRVPGLYGVLDERYLVPVAMPMRIPGAVDVDQVLRLVSPCDVANSLIWRELAAASNQCLASGGANAQQQQALGVLARSPSFSATAGLDHLVSTNDDRESSHELTHNLLLRLFVAMAKGQLTIDEFGATFRCRFFRSNVTQPEIKQFLAVRALLTARPESPAGAVVEHVVGQLSIAPPNEYYEPDEFEIVAEQPDLERFDLFVQENVGELRYPVAGLDFSGGAIALAFV